MKDMSNGFVIKIEVDSQGGRAFSRIRIFGAASPVKTWLREPNRQQK